MKNFIYTLQVAFFVCLFISFIWAFIRAIDKAQEMNEMKQAEICEMYPEAHCGQ